jgi:tetratricopeptide (TPR) repeat protein
VTSCSKLIPWAVAALAFLACLPALDAGFVNWDDPANILDNEAYRGLGWTQITWMFTTTRMAVYTPLAWVSLGINYVLGGMDPWGYHLGNLLIHAGNTALYFLVARRLLRAAGGGDAPWGIDAGAALAALVFGLHPLRVESVVWVTERRDVLCGWFYLLAVLAYLRGVDAGRSRPWIVASLAAFAGALLSKGLAMTLPATLLIVDVYPLGRHRRPGWAAILREKLPYALLAAAAAVAAVIALRRDAVIRDYSDYGPAARVAMVAYSLFFYPWKLVWPTRLGPMYELPARVDPLEPRFLGPLALVVVVTLALVALARRWPPGVAAWTHSAVAVAPISGLVHAGNQLAHDRYSYLSGLGFALVAGGGLAWAANANVRGRVGRGILTAILVAASLVVAGLGAATWRQTQIWHDSVSLWWSSVVDEPACANCLNGLGRAFLERGQAEVAETAFREAVALRPDLPISHNNLGVALAMQGRDDEAAAAFREALRRAPGLVHAYVNLADVHVRRREDRIALGLMAMAMRLDPEYPGLTARIDRVRAGLARSGGDARPLQGR